MEFIISWATLAVAIFVASYLLSGVTVSGLGTAFIVALVLGIVNALIKPVLLFLALPINIITLGLFTLVINAILVMLVAAIVPNFRTQGFWWALAFSIVVTLVNVLLSSLLGV